MGKASPLAVRTIVCLVVVAARPVVVVLAITAPNGERVCAACLRVQVSVGRFITDVVVGAGAIDLSDLCIQEGVSSWVIYADLVCLNYDGNILVEPFLPCLVLGLGCGYGCC